MGNLKRHDWTLYKQASLEILKLKSNLQLDRFLQEFLKGCHELCSSKKGKGTDTDEEIYTTGEEDMAVVESDVEPDKKKSKKRRAGKGGEKESMLSIGADRAKFCLDKIELFRKLREEIMTKPDEYLIAALERARRSSGLPKWWQSGAAHDVPFLKALAKYGMAVPRLFLTDHAYPFIDIILDELSKKTKKVQDREQNDLDTLDDSEVTKLIGWPNDSIIQRRLEYLIDLVGKHIPTSEDKGEEEEHARKGKRRSSVEPSGENGSPKRTKKPRQAKISFSKQNQEHPPQSGGEEGESENAKK